MYNAPVLAVAGKKKFVAAPHIDWNPELHLFSIDLSGIQSFPIAIAFPITLSLPSVDAKHKV